MSRFTQLLALNILVSGGGICVSKPEKEEWVAYCIQDELTCNLNSAYCEWHPDEEFPPGVCTVNPDMGPWAEFCEIYRDDFEMCKRYYDYCHWGEGATQTSQSPTTTLAPTTTQAPTTTTSIAPTTITQATTTQAPTTSSTSPPITQTTTLAPASTLPQSTKAPPSTVAPTTSSTSVTEGTTPVIQSNDNQTESEPDEESSNVAIIAGASAGAVLAVGGVAAGASFMMGSSNASSAALDADQIDYPTELEEREHEQDVNIEELL